jgi:hypothetical protein
MGWAFPPIDVLVVVEVTVSVGGGVTMGVLVSVGGMISSTTGRTSSSTTTGSIVVVLEQKVRQKQRLKSIGNFFIIE